MGGAGGGKKQCVVRLMNGEHQFDVRAARRCSPNPILPCAAGFELTETHNMTNSDA